MMLNDAVKVTASLKDPSKLGRELELPQEIINKMETEISDKDASKHEILKKWIYLNPYSSLDKLETVVKKMKGM